MFSAEEDRLPLAKEDGHYHAQGDRAVSRKPLSPWLHIVLYRPEIAANTGNVGRTCVALGAKLWLVRPLGFRLDDRRLRRAGLDYWQYLDWQAVDDFRDLRRYLAEERCWYFTKRASRPYTAAAFQPGDALVFGGESQGLPADLLAAAGQRGLYIPIRPEARSLNLSVAVAVAAFEALRQGTAAADKGQ